jgi:protein-S-isoprenylcysteine O-methyltransferase Ste14
MDMVLLRTIGFTIIVPGTFAVLVPYLIVTRLNSGDLDGSIFVGISGLSLTFVGVAIYFLCAWEFAQARGTPAPIDPPRELVIKGLYRYTRNPMYIGVMFILFGESVLFLSGPILVYAGLMFVVFELFIVFYEEPTLTRLFGRAYEQYRATVPRWFR